MSDMVSNIGEKITPVGVLGITLYIINEAHIYLGIYFSSIAREILICSVTPMTE